MTSSHHWLLQMCFFPPGKESIFGKSGHNFENFAINFRSNRIYHCKFDVVTKLLNDPNLWQNIIFNWIRLEKFQTQLRQKKIKSIWAWGFWITHWMIQLLWKLKAHKFVRRSLVLFNSIYFINDGFLLVVIARHVIFDAFHFSKENAESIHQADDTRAFRQAKEYDRYIHGFWCILDESISSYYFQLSTCYVERSKSIW